MADDHVQPYYIPLDPAPDRPEWDSARAPRPFVFSSADGVDDDSLSPAEIVRSQEARDVSRIIATALHQGWQKEIGRAGSYHNQPISLSDICILITSRAPLPSLEKSLDAAGIEFRSEASSLVYSTQEVHDLLLTCRSLANTADEAALVAALRTPLFGCGDDDLLRWKSVGGRWDWFSDAPVGLGDSVTAAALNYLKSVWFELPSLNPGSLLSKIAVDRRVFEVSMDSPRHRDVWRRLRFVIDQAHAWYGEDRGDLRDYLEWALTQQEENARVAEAVLPEIGVNAVRIMTMHAAKGLQFPMVIVAGMSGGFRNTQDPVVWDADGQMHVNVSKTVRSTDYGSVWETEKRHTEAERIRLLYVACTRAESVLAVSGHIGARAGWGNLVLQGMEGVPNVVPELIEPVRSEDTGLQDVSSSLSWEEWNAETELVAITSSLPSSMSATQVAHPTTSSGVAVRMEYGIHVFPAGSAEVVSPATDSSESGSALGTALHSVLEQADLADTLDDEVVRAAAIAAGLSDLDRFTGLATSAFESEPVRRASVREHWKQMQLAGMSPDGTLVVEGIADLVYRDDIGSL